MKPEPTKLFDMLAQMNECCASTARQAITRKRLNISRYPREGGGSDAAPAPSIEGVRRSKG